MKEELEKLKAKIKKQPRDAITLRKLGQHYLKNRAYKRAFEEYRLSINFNPRLTSEIMLDHERLLAKDSKQINLRLSLISFLINNHEVDTAILELEELIEIDPTNSSVYNMLGRIYIQLNEIDKALTLLEQAQTLGVKNIGISQMLAGVYLEKGRHKDAIKFYNELLTHSPNDKNVIRTLGELYTRIDEIDYAAESYNQLFLHDPEAKNEVQKKLEELLMKDETNIKTREILAEVYMQSLKPDRAAEKLNEILLLDPNRIDFVIKKNKKILKNYPNHPQALLTLSSVQVRKGNFSEAIQNLDRLIKNHPEHASLAVQSCNHILEKYPDQYLAHQFLIEVYLNQEDYQKAIEKIKKLLALHQEAADWVITNIKDKTKKEPLLHEPLGYAYLKKEDHEKAFAAAEKLLTYRDDYARGHLLQGIVYLNKNQNRKAYHSFQNALRLAPLNTTIHNLLKEADYQELEKEKELLKRTSHHFELAKVYSKLDQQKEALKELQIAANEEKKILHTYNLMGELYIQAGRFNLAQSVINKALAEIKEEDRQIKHKLEFNLALCYETGGNIKMSLKLLEGILATELNFPGLQEKINFLKESNLKSMQNKALALVLLQSEKKATFALWGRESKNTTKKQNITESFGASHNDAGFDYYSKGMQQAAIEEFELASKIDPALISATNNLGVVYLESARLNEAIQKFKEGLRIDNASSIVLNNSGVAYFLYGASKEALRYFKLARELNPGLAAAAFNLARVAYKEGEIQLALDSLLAIPANDILYPLAQKELTYKQP
ncbi:tetratricopeptide repeat protein [Candidatus Margulisiibacteriota bacterium]